MDTGNGSGTLDTKDEKIRIDYSKAYNAEDRKEKIQRFLNVSDDDVLKEVWQRDYNNLTETQANVHKKFATEQFDHLVYECQMLVMSIEMLAQQNSEDEEIIKALKDKINLFTECKDLKKRRNLFWEKYAKYTSDGMFDGLISSDVYLNGGNFICPPGKIVSAKAFETLIYFDAITFDEKDIEEGVKCQLPQNIKKIYILFGKKYHAVCISSTEVPAVLERSGKEILIFNDNRIVKVSKNGVCNT